MSDQIWMTTSWGGAESAIISKCSTKLDCELILHG